MKYTDKRYWQAEFANYNYYGVPDECVPAIDEALDKIFALDPDAKIVQIKTKFNSIRLYVTGAAGVQDLAREGERNAERLWNAR